MKSSIINLLKKYDKMGVGDCKLFIFIFVIVGYIENVDICILRILCVGFFRFRVLIKYLKFMLEVIFW